MYTVFYESSLMDMRVVADTWFSSLFSFLPLACKAKVISFQLNFKLKWPHNLVLVNEIQAKFF